MSANPCKKFRKIDSKVWYGFDFAYSKSSLGTNEKFFKDSGYRTKIMKCSNPNGWGLYVTPDQRKNQSQQAVERLKSAMGMV